MSVQDKLSDRGYWRLEIRPKRYVERRIPSFEVLKKAIEAATIQFRGLTFPQLDRNWGPPAGLTWLAQEVDAGANIECWRAYLSGQFVHKGGIWTDWLDQRTFWSVPKDWKPKTELPVVSSIWTLTECFEFAARYAQIVFPESPVTLRITLFGISNRVLHLDHERRTPFDFPRQARIATFPFVRQLDVPTLLATSKDLAIAASASLFEFFDWTPGDALIKELQHELFVTRGGG
jgi:hypothetical protein